MIGFYFTFLLVLYVLFSRDKMTALLKAVVLACFGFLFYTLVYGP